MYPHDGPAGRMERVGELRNFCDEPGARAVGHETEDALLGVDDDEGGVGVVFHVSPSQRSKY